MEDIVIALQHISKTFASVKALNDVGFSICAGEVHALMGENGAGKSTLIKVLTGVYEPDTGAEIQVGAERFTQLTPLEAVKKGIAVTYQDFSLFPNLTVAENISISSEVEKNTGILSWRRMRDNAREVMEKMKIDIDPDAQLGALSAAKQQLVAIARALVHDAKLLILDEPTSALSANEVDKLFGIIDQLRKQGLAILFVSHKIDEVFRISDRITVLRDGTYIGTYPVQEVTPDDIINRMVGRNVEYERCTSENVKENVLLEVRGLTKAGNYKDINFRLHEGEILGRTGLVGAGRTEVCQSIYGITTPDSGEIFISGHQVKVTDTKRGTQLGIAFVPEDRREQGLVTKKSIKNNLSITVIQTVLNRLRMIDDQKETEIAERYLKELEVRPELPQLEAGKLSGGNQQKVVIGKCLAMNPRILIIDEPTNGIDVGAKRKIHQLLKKLAEQGMGIIMVSSELPEVLSVSNRILVMRRGHITGEFQSGEATQEQIMHKAIL